MWVAWRWLSNDYWPPILLIAVVIGAAYTSDAIGRKLLPKRPVAALIFLEWWLVAPLALGTLASAGLVLLSVKLALPEGTPPDRKELIGALSSGVTTFMTSIFISWAGDQDYSRLAKRIQRIFFSKYDRFDPSNPATKKDVKYFAAESLGEELVYSEAVAGIDGWGRTARRTRATELAAELESGNSEPQPTPPQAREVLPLAHGWW
jgi:hypothetical protein